MALNPSLVSSWAFQGLVYRTVFLGVARVRVRMQEEHPILCALPGFEGLLSVKCAWRLLYLTTRTVKEMFCA
jgi:hypothetical protein